MKRRILSVFMALCLMSCMIFPAFAEVSPTEMRHSIVCVEVGIEGPGGYMGLGSGTGFFVGKNGTNPQFLLTNYHVIEDFISWGSGELKSLSFEEFALGVITAAGYTADQVTEAMLNVIWDYWKQFMGSVNSGKLRAKIRLYYDNSDYEEGYLVDSDKIRDMALLRLEKPTDKRAPMAVTIPSENMVTKTVYSVGYPGVADNEYFESVHQRGENDATVSSGTVSRLLVTTGTGVASVQTDVDIKHGNSGGPLVFENGAAIGITAWGVTNEDLESVKYALSMEEIVPMLDRNNVTYEQRAWPEKSGPDSKVVIAAVCAVGAAVAIVVIVLQSKKKAVTAETTGGGTGTGGGSRGVPGGGPVKPVAPPANDSGFRIQGVSGILENRRFMIHKDKPIVMGRNSKLCGIVFPEDARGVSGRHCSVWVDNGQVYLKDLGSTHGTFLEPGQRLAAEQAVAVQEGQRFWLGSEQESFVIAKKK